LFVFVGVRPFDVLLEVYSCDGNPFVEPFVEVVEIAIKLPPALGVPDAEDFGAAGLAVFRYEGDASNPTEVSQSSVGDAVAPRRPT